MPSLTEVAVSGSDIAVGASGFGSASVGISRWVDLALLTGRTTYGLSYDSQDLPMAIPLVTATAELYRRWGLARSGAMEAASFLSPQIEDWTRSGRDVLLVGFSLGAFAIWEAVRGVHRDLWPRIQVFLISGALVDSPEQWEGAEDLGILVNAYSSSDLVLRWLYPRGVSEGETPAAGLGPLVIQGRRIFNVDLTDLIGADHLWAGENLPQILRICLGVSWATSGLGSPSPPKLPSPEELRLSPESISRLSAWLLCVPELWELLSVALSGDPGPISELEDLDRWSLEGDRLVSLVDAGQTASVLLSSRTDLWSSSRALLQIEGLVRRWISG